MDALREGVGRILLIVFRWFNMPQKAPEKAKPFQIINSLLTVEFETFPLKHSQMQQILSKSFQEVEAGPLASLQRDPC